jgi:putative exosortase-associated protein (TIGR04073 family)
MSRLKNNISKLVLILTIGVFLLAPTSNRQVHAVISTSIAEVERENTDVYKMSHKLGRGVMNILTGWVEIPKQTAKEWQATDPLTGTIMGVTKGFVTAVTRTIVGVFEVVSFPFPVPRNYEPVMEPEFVLPTVWGERLPMYRDEFTSGSGSVQNSIDYGSNKTTSGR